MSDTFSSKLTKVDFSRNLGVIVCAHVFEATRPIMLVCHENNLWQCLCGQDDHHGADDGHLVGIGHLLDRDDSLAQLSDLPPGWQAERDTPNSDWKRMRLESA